MNRRLIFFLLSLVLCCGFAWVYGIQGLVWASDLDILWKYADKGSFSGSLVSPIDLYSNKPNRGESEIILRLYTQNDNAVTIRKLDDPRNYLLLTSTSGISDSSLTLIPQLAPGGGTGFDYGVEVRIGFATLPTYGGTSGIKILASQAFGVDNDSIIEFNAVTLPTYASKALNSIHIGPGSINYNQTGSSNWYSLDNGYHFDVDRSAGPLSQILSIQSNSSGGSIMVDKLNDSWQFYYNSITSPDRVTKSTVAMKDANNASFNIDFFYSDLATTVNTMTIVPLSSPQSSLIERGSLFCFKVYANYGSGPATEYEFQNGTFSDLAENGDHYLMLTFTKDGVSQDYAVLPCTDPNHTEAHYAVEPRDGNPIGVYTITAAYRADPGKKAEISLAWVDDPAAITWQNLTGKLPEEFSGVSFTSSTENGAAANLYLSPTKDYSSVVIDLHDYLNTPEPYDNIVWSVETSAGGYNSAVATASLSNNKLTLKPVAMGSSVVTLVSANKDIRVRLPVTVSLPDYTQLQVEYKLNGTTYKDGQNKDGSPVEALVNLLSEEKAPMTAELVMGKSIKLTLKYLNTDTNNETPYDLPNQQSFPGNGYWYVENPHKAYLTVTPQGVVTAISVPPDVIQSLANPTPLRAADPPDIIPRIIHYVDYFGNRVVTFEITILPKANVALDNWDTLAVTYKEGKNNVTISAKETSVKNPIMISLDSKPITFKPSVTVETKSGDRQRKPKAYFVSSSPTIYVSSKGVVRPISVGNAVVQIFTIDSGVITKSVPLYLEVTKLSE
ncbi:MAG: hypothetical protein FWF06_00515 [Symbiobacteriaceae bacterium]|nr:hypothetical protein [Symbiobacteriaceae bacterium]